MLADLDNEWEVLAEPIQTVMRRSTLLFTAWSDEKRALSDTVTKTHMSN